MDSLWTYRFENPEHYNADITVLITKRDLAIGSRDLAGYANIKSVCSASSMAIVELVDNGLDGQTLAHEIAHVLGAVHDGDEPCENEDSNGYLMSSRTHTGTDFLSQCSIDTINSTIDIFGGCLLEDNTTSVEPPVVSDVPQSSSGGGGSIDIAFFLLLLVLSISRKFLTYRTIPV